MFKVLARENRQLSIAQSVAKPLMVLAIFLSLQGTGLCFSIDVERLANAIYHAEGGSRTKFPYGIKSINTHGNKAYARQICINTINNQIKRHSKHNCNKDFLTCLRDRYCPLSDSPMNVSWLRNVRLLYGGEK